MFPGNATFVIHKDGTATLTTATQAIEAMGMLDAANDWTVYENTQNYLDGNATATSGNRYKAHVDKTYTVNGKKKPAQISFIVPDLKAECCCSQNVYKCYEHQSGCVHWS